MADKAIPTNVTNGQVNLASATTTTASVTAHATGAILVGIGAFHASGFSDSATISGMGSTTWTKIAGVLSAATTEYMAAWIGYGSMSSGTIAVVLSRTPTNGTYTVSEQLQCDLSSNPLTTSIYTNTNTGTAMSVAYTAFVDGAQRLFAYFAHKINETTAAGTGWTNLDRVNQTTWSLQNMYQTGNCDFVADTAAITSSPWLAIAAEFKKFNYLGTLVGQGDDLSPDKFSSNSAKRVGEPGGGILGGDGVWAFLD